MNNMIININVFCYEEERDMIVCFLNF